MRGQPHAARLPRILLGLGLLSSAWAWWLIATPVMTFSTDRHAGHFATVFLHVCGGTLMLFLGVANLYVGLTRTGFRWHKLIGRAYLLGGAIGAIGAIVVTSSMAHKPAAGPVLTNATISLLTLATAWLVAAALGWRAALHRRIDSHRDWMIRSYVLAWAFVFCRIVSRVPAVADLGNGEAFIWLSWVAPLLVCEWALQWRDGAGATRGA
jgi:hypothetical protein